MEKNKGDRNRKVYKTDNLCRVVRESLAAWRSDGSERMEHTVIWGKAFKAGETTGANALRQKEVWNSSSSMRWPVWLKQKVENIM